MTTIAGADERTQLRDTIRRFVHERTPMSRVRDTIDSAEPYDQDVWRVLGVEFGLAGLVLPEEFGGVGAGYSDLSVALTELGAGLVPSPLLATIIAGEVLLALGDDARTLLRALAGGTVVGTLAVTEPTLGAPSWIPDRPTVSLTDGNRLHGEKITVLNGAEADLLLVHAITGDEVVICAVEAGAEGLRRSPSRSMDPTLSVAALRFDGVPATRLRGDVAASLGRARDVANLVLAAQHSGAMAACVRMTSDYARLRVAFGQPIGAFQAVKHSLANLHTAWELGTAALLEATRCADEAPERLTTAAAIARHLLSPAYLRAAGETIQLHGGIGYTWEHDAHLYYKNAAAGRLLCGSPTEQLDLIAGQLGLAT